MYSFTPFEHFTSIIIVEPGSSFKTCLAKMAKILSAKTISPFPSTKPSLSASPSNPNPKSNFFPLTSPAKSFIYSGTVGSGRWFGKSPSGSIYIPSNFSPSLE